MFSARFETVALAHDAVLDFAIFWQCDAVADDATAHVAAGLDANVVHDETVGNSNLFLNLCVSTQGASLRCCFVRYNCSFSDIRIWTDLK